MTEFATILILILFMSAFVSTADILDDFFTKDAASRQRLATIYAQKWQHDLDEKTLQDILAKGKVSPDIMCEIVSILKMAGKYEQAVRVYKAIPENYKIPDKIRVEIAVAYFKMGKFRESSDLFETYLPSNEKDEALVEMMVESCIGSGDSDKALKYLENCTAGGGEKPSWLKRLVVRAKQGKAVETARTGNHKDAIASLKQLIDETGDRKSVYYDYIVILSWDSQYNEALKAFDEISSQENIPPYVLTAAYNSYKHTNNREGMLAISKKLGIPMANELENFPAEVKKIEPEEVKETAKEPMVAEQLINSGKLLEALDEISKSPPDETKKDELNKALSVIHDKAVQLAREKKYDESLAVLDRLIDIGHDKSAVICDKIIVLVWAEKYNGAIELYEKYRESNTPDFNLLALIGSAYRKTGKYPEAIRCYDESLSLNKDNPDAVKGKVFTLVAAGKSDEAFTFIQDDMRSRKVVPPWLNLLTGEAFLVEGKTEEAESFFSDYLAKNPDNLFAKKILAGILIQRKHRLDEAGKLVGEILSAEPANTDIMFLKVTLLQINNDYIEAYELNEKILALNRDYQPAVNAKYHILLDMKALVRANEIQVETGDKVSLRVKRRLASDLAAAELSWQEPNNAFPIIDTTMKSNNEDRMSSKITAEEYNVMTKRELLDELLAFYQTKDMRKVVGVFEELSAKGMKLPAWAKITSASAYSSCRNLDTAYALYKEVYEELKSQGKDVYPDNYDVLMAMYSTLIDLEKQRAANEILNRLDKEVPPFARPNGILVENKHKMEIEMEKGWQYVYDDQLSYADEYLTELQERAPYNSNVRTALAYVHLYRGWPRQALEDFQIAAELDPNDRAAQVGLAYALNENDDWEEARSVAAELAKKYPMDLDVKKLQRSFELQQMRTLSVDANYSNAGSFVDGSSITMRLDQPIFPDRKIYTEGLWLMTSQPKDSNQHGARRNILRGALGFDWRLARELKFFGEASMDYHAENPGFMGGLSFNPIDQLTLTGFYNSYTLNMPPKALLYNHKGQEANVSAEYRMSEDFNVKVGFSNVWVSGGNINQTYSWRLDKGIYSTADWKFRVALEGSTTTNTDIDTDYYSPKYYTSIYLVPMVEHVWYRRYDTSIVDRLFLGAGPHWEKDFNCRSQYYLRYEQEYQLTDTLSFKVGGRAGKERYGSDSPLSWGFYSGLTWKF